MGSSADLKSTDSASCIETQLLVDMCLSAIVPACFRCVLLNSTTNLSLVFHVGGYSQSVNAKEISHLAAFMRANK
jgi:hypothetical protein